MYVVYIKLQLSIIHRGAICLGVSWKTTLQLPFSLGHLLNNETTSVYDTWV